MSDLFEQGKAIVRGESSRPLEAFRRLRNAIVTGGDITLSDRDLVLAAIEANRLRLHSCAIVALDELSLRMVSDETPEQMERRVA